MTTIELPPDEPRASLLFVGNSIPRNPYTGEHMDCTAAECVAMFPEAHGFVVPDPADSSS